MWVRRSAIRPVPPYARVSDISIARVRNQLLEDNAESHHSLDRAFDDFEETQPALADFVGQILSRPLCDPLLAVGYFLSLALWLTFEKTMGPALRSVSDDELHSTTELFALDERLRETEPQEALETDDVISMEQPALLRFVHEQMGATLDHCIQEANADDLRLIYRMLLIQILALSYAVEAPSGFPVSKAEALA